MCHYSLSLAPSLLPHHFFKQKPVCPPSFPSVCLSPSDSYCSATCILLKSEALEIVAQLSWSVGLWEGAESGRTVISRAGEFQLQQEVDSLLKDTRVDWGDTGRWGGAALGTFLNLQQSLCQVIRRTGHMLYCSLLSVSSLPLVLLDLCPHGFQFIILLLQPLSPPQCCVIFLHSLLSLQTLHPDTLNKQISCQPQRLQPTTSR